MTKIIKIFLVGDKQAHEATVHIPQMFYFSLFTLIFGPTMWIPNVKKFLKHAGTAKGILMILTSAAIIAAIIHFNTVVHPYLLADNRHYTFYVWNRLYNRNIYIKFLMIPVYIFGLYNFFASMEGSIGFKVFFTISTLMTLCLQALIEVRYFLIPFLILRLNQTSVEKKWSLVELLVNILINFLTFKVFFTVETRWPEFEEAQRIIW